MSKQNVPDLRLDGFSDDWTETTLGDTAAEFQSGDFLQADDITQHGSYPVYGGNGLRGYTDKYNHSGLYTLIGRQGALCGNINTSDGKAYFTEHAIAVKANQEHDTLFLSYLFGILNLGQYSAQSAQPGLAVGTIKEVKTRVPSPEEQQAIGAIFTNLDTTIGSHRKKLDLLKQTKTSLLQRMFPQDGATVPELRLDGFHDAWTETTLGDTAIEFQSGDFLPADQIGQHGTYPVYGGNSLRGYTDKYNHSGLYTLIGRQGALCGNINISDGKAYFTEHAIAVKANRNHDTLFLSYLFGILNLGQYSAQSAQPGLAVGTIKEVKTLVPTTVDEQRAIGAILSKLDLRITAEAQYIDKLTQTKTALLQKMFV